MNCYNCGGQGDYNRLAIDRASGQELGTLCEDCEERLLGNLAAFSIVGMGSCLTCDADSDVVFPKWDTIVESETGVTDVEYTVSLDTPAMCRSCLSAVVDDPVVEGVNQSNED